MSAHLSRLRLFQRHLRSLVWVWVWVWDWIHSHTPPRTRSPSSRHPPFTHYPFPLRSLVGGGQPSPRPPLSSSPHAHSFVLGTAVINTHTGKPESLKVQRRESSDGDLPPRPLGETPASDSECFWICRCPARGDFAMNKQTHPWYVGRGDGKCGGEVVYSIQRYQATPQRPT